MTLPRNAIFGLGVLAIASLTAQAAQAHAVAGARVFVNTLLIDDPGVGDEANLPIYSVTSPDGKSTVTDLNFEYDKTITSSLGVGAGTDYDWITNDLMDNKKSHGGFDDPYVQVKYRWLLMPEHELISSVAIQQDFGRAGTTGIDTGYDTTVVSGYFGKGLGDIPFAPIRPFAMTGELPIISRNRLRLGIWRDQLLDRRPDPAIFHPLPAVSNQRLRSAAGAREPDALGRTRLEFRRRELRVPADRRSHDLHPGHWRGMDRRVLFTLDRTALAPERCGRAWARRHRAVSPVFRRPVPKFTRQAPDRIMMT